MLISYHEMIAARLPRPALTPLGLGAAQHHAGAEELGHQAAGVVADFALDEAELAGALGDAGDGAQARLPDGLEELAREVQRGEALAVLQRRGHGAAHGAVGEIAEDAAV